MEQRIGERAVEADAGGLTALCPLCRAPFHDAARYRDHLMTEHDLSDDKGAETRLPASRVAPPRRSPGATVASPSAAIPAFPPASPGSGDDGAARARRGNARLRVLAAAVRLRLAERARRRAIRSAKHAYDAAVKDRSAKIRDVASELEYWRDPGRGERLATVRDVRLYARRLFCRSGSAPVVGAHAWVEHQPDGPMMLIVQTENFTHRRNLRARHAGKARFLAGEVNLGAIRAEAFERTRHEKIQTEEVRLADLQADAALLAAIEDARERLEGLRSGRIGEERVTEARHALDRARERLPQRRTAV